MIEFDGLYAPFMLSWIGVWLFAALGGLASAFILIDDIDKRLRMPFIAKPLIGTAAGVVMALFINGDAEPPPANLAFWAFIGSLCSTPLITGLLVFISDQERQNALYKSAQDKFLPWQKDKGGDDDIS